MTQVTTQPSVTLAKAVDKNKQSYSPDTGHRRHCPSLSPRPIATQAHHSPDPPSPRQVRAQRPSALSRREPEWETAGKHSNSPSTMWGIGRGEATAAAPHQENPRGATSRSAGKERLRPHYSSLRHFSPHAHSPPPRPSVTGADCTRPPPTPLAAHGRAAARSEDGSRVSAGPHRKPKRLRHSLFCALTVARSLTTAAASFSFLPPFSSSSSSLSRRRGGSSPLRAALRRRRRAE